MSPSEYLYRFEAASVRTELTIELVSHFGIRTKPPLAAYRISKFDIGADRKVSSGLVQSAPASKPSLARTRRSEEASGVKVELTANVEERRVLDRSVGVGDVD